MFLVKGILSQLALMAVLEKGYVSSLKCFVGRGPSTMTLYTDAQDLARLEKNETAPFGLFTCGDHGSEFALAEHVARNASDLIHMGAMTTENKRRRRRRQTDNYACMKVLYNHETYRTCTLKSSAPAGGTMNCTLPMNNARLAVCYCNEDHCNGAEGSFLSEGFKYLVLLLSLGLFATF